MFGPAAKFQIRKEVYCHDATVYQGIPLVNLTLCEIRSLFFGPHGRMEEWNLAFFLMSVIGFVSAKENRRRRRKRRRRRRNYYILVLVTQRLAFLSKYIST